MTETRKTRPTKTLTASELGGKLASVVAKHSAIAKGARSLAAAHFAGSPPPEAKK